MVNRMLTLTGDLVWITAVGVGVVVAAGLCLFWWLLTKAAEWMDREDRD